jgi:hypothetical protein
MVLEHFHLKTSCRILIRRHFDLDRRMSLKLTQEPECLEFEQSKKSCQHGRILSLQRVGYMQIGAPAS